MTALLHLIFQELNTPSGQVGPLSSAYGRAMTGIAHGVLGAAFAVPFGVLGIGAALAIAAIFWVAKERGDLRRGGKFWDGIEDAALVGFGAFWAHPYFFAALIGFAGLVLLSAALRVRA